ncbi:hypothetical protein EVAR_29964_1 [Eumeta japonica]|uniref:Uncharacterized protein n=1 Tax=Eumeta variegata TaxID=151549 RepID=A0A4C1VHE2_EUMVA|nr:hypothetical protein EVAR_29964_1 [Eumeta japonica]
MRRDWLITIMLISCETNRRTYYSDQERVGIDAVDYTTTAARTDGADDIGTKEGIKQSNDDIEGCHFKSAPGDTQTSYATGSDEDQQIFGTAEDVWSAISRGSIDFFCMRRRGTAYAQRDICLK